jgi:hypothetical protein
VAGLRVVVEVVSHLRPESHLVAAVGEHLADYLLAPAVAVHVAGVDERRAPVDGVFDQFDRLGLRAVPPPVGADDPRAERDLAHRDVGIAERSRLHTRT